MIGVVAEGAGNRSVENRAVADFLIATGAQPSVLVIDGEAGIGKTTLWLAASEQAGERGFRVLSAAAGQAESILAYAAVADLLSDVESAVLTALPDVQRIALERVLLRANGDGPATDQRVVAAAFLSVVEDLAANSPVLVAIDDVQWLDSSSKSVVAFAIRRLRGPIGVLLTERTEPDTENAGWLQLNRPGGVERFRVRPLTIGGLHTLFLEKLGRSFPRPTMVRIAELSGGNPFYALELARAMGGLSPESEAALPATLAGLVRARIGRLDNDARNVLLAAACTAEPTVDLLARATGAGVERTVELLEEPEDHDIIRIDGNRVHFSHPLLARSVYTDAGPARRRRMHRALADVVTLPELRARHLGLAATRADPETLRALDEAADAALARGAPAAAAELIELAIRLGGDTSSRRIRAAQHRFQAGDTGRAQAVLAPTIDAMEPGPLRAIAFDLLAGMRIYDNSFLQAGDRLKAALDDATSNPVVLVQTLLMLSFVQLNSDEYSESLRHARQAVTVAEELDIPTLTSQALAMWVRASFTYGQGFDESALKRALELEDPHIDVPIPFRASAINALIMTCTGRLDEARTQMRAIRQHCVERGAEGDIVAIAGYSTWADIWQGRFSDAAESANDAVERAEQLGGDHVLVIPLSVRAAVAAYTGRERDARADAHNAMGAQRGGSPRLPGYWPAMALGFLEVSVGRYAEALTTLQPVLSIFNSIPSTEILSAWYIPDAVEAMIALGHFDDAEPLTEALERNGRRLDRAWMLAVGARCRSMWLAARGDVGAAEEVAHQAITEHQRLPMPFERARTQLLLGQLQRRQRRKEPAAETLHEALRAFEAMGTPLWAERARAELARTKVSPARDLGLTPTEQRVAELAASGMTNRDVAATLFISPKTVEHNLSRVYRKLGIRSRAELGQWMRQTQR
ncbi:MAG TPA: AAA family ATPase [Mycobacterium sp.]|uniref:helix-turn-helix transcriptional regulator n=1 Tax=Mycobacterium sp. TaxID=1785 RepID=UPI002D550BDE|nr:AAA family ATPase [Mycobacterium sp.]HZU47232.1 AAA family ATPase [Mycobacterium sp.]